MASKRGVWTQHVSAASVALADLLGGLQQLGEASATAVLICVWTRGADRESGVVCRLRSPLRVFDPALCPGSGTWLPAPQCPQRKMTLLRSERSQWHGHQAACTGQVPGAGALLSSLGLSLRRHLESVFWAASAGLVQSQCPRMLGEWVRRSRVEQGARPSQAVAGLDGVCWWWWGWRWEGQGNQGACLKGTCTSGRLVSWPSEQESFELWGPGVYTMSNNHSAINMASPIAEGQQAFWVFYTCSLI